MAKFVLVLLVFLTMSIADSSTLSSSPLMDLFMKTFIRTIETPIVPESSKESPFSMKIFLENDVFTLSDGLRLFIQQFIIAMYNGHIGHLPDDWETRYPHYDRVITEINNLLDLIDEQPLSKISVKDVRPLIESLSMNVLVELQQLIGEIEENFNKETQMENDKQEL